MIVTNRPSYGALSTNMKILLRLPKPPSANHLFATVGKRRVVSQQYKKWRTEAYAMLMVQRVALNGKPIGGRYRIECAIPRGKRRADLDNAYKSVSDALVAMGIVHDDSMADDIRLRWSDDSKECEIIVEGLA